MTTELETVVSLRPCPCGRPIDDLIITDNGQGGKYMLVSGNCCGEWQIEFRANYHKAGTAECKELARKAWNGAPRAN